MAEMVYRRKRRRKVRMLDENRFMVFVPTREQAAAVLRGIGQALPGFMLALCEMMDMPSGLHAAYIAALAALSLPVRWPLAGAGAAMALRLLSGLDPRWEGLLTLAMLAAAPLLLPGRGNLPLMAFTAASLLPMAVRGWFAPTALETVLALGSLLFCALCAPPVCRGVKALTARAAGGRPRPIEATEDRMGAAFLALLIICGGARVLLVGLNVGMLTASASVLLVAMLFGAGAGCASGIIAGLCLSMTGLPMLHAVALGAGGFLAGVMQATERRWLACASFAVVTAAAMIVGGVTGVGCAAASVVAPLAIMLLPQRAISPVCQHLQRFRSRQAQSSDAYAASMLAAWEKTVDAMALSVPSPQEDGGARDGQWWSARLCGGCEEAANCSAMASGAVLDRMEAVWEYRSAEEAAWQGALDGLRGLGCQRLYRLQHAMESLRREDAASRRHIRRAMDQRSMLVTHLTAMAGAARRFAYLSQGESWWEAVTARRVRAALSDAAAPVQLLWLRRVDGHVQAAFALEDITGARRQAGELCSLVTEAAGVPMTTASIDNGRICLAQRPPMEAVCGVAAACMQGQRSCGDTAWHGLLQDGRFMAAVSDGMGHGEDAALSSRQTVELLSLCLDAGYTMQQALTAVNGMMLLGGSGERFITVDLLILDLWTGRAFLEKLGAAGSWLSQGEELTLLNSDALPLGILEDVDAAEKMLRLQPGDALILMTDGVEEAFADRVALRDAITLALTEASPDDAAQSLLQAAQRSHSGTKEDDQTVLVMRIRPAREDAE